MIVASQASRRTVSGARRSPDSAPAARSPGATEPAAQGLEVDGDEQLALRAPGRLVGRRDRSAHQGDERVAASPVARAQVALTVDRLRRRQRTQRRLEHRLALRRRGSAGTPPHPLVDARLRQRHEPLRPRPAPAAAGRRAPYGRQQLRPQLPALARHRPRTAIRDQPVQHRRPAPPRTSSGSSLSASDTTTAALRTGNTPDSTASLTGALPATANACATDTTCTGPTRHRRRSMPPHPRHRRQGVGARPGLSAADRLRRDDHPRRLPRHDHRVDVAHHLLELGRTGTPQLALDPSARLGPGRDPRQSLVEWNSPCHALIVQVSYDTAFGVVHSADVWAVDSLDVPASRIAPPRNGQAKPRAHRRHHSLRTSGLCHQATPPTSVS